MKTRSSRAKDLTTLVIGIACVLLVLFIGSFTRVRADLTSEKRYTLTDASRNLVDSLKDVVFVKVFLAGELPADLRQLSQGMRDLLDEMRVRNPDKLQYEFSDPNASADEKTRNEVYAQLQKEGLNYTSIRTKGKGAQGELIVWPCAIVSYRNKTVPVQLLKTQFRTPDAEMVNRSLNNLEYEVASAIRNVMATHRPRIAFLEGHGEAPEMQTKDIRTALQEQYDVTSVRIDGQVDALSDKVEIGAFRQNKFEALVIVKPDSAFSQKDQYIIDQFLMNGGRLMWVVDPMNAHLDSLRAKQYSIATPYPLGIEQLLFAQGVRLNNDLLLDKQCAPIQLYTTPYGNQPKLETLPFPFEPIVIPRSNHPIVSNIDPVHLRFASSIDTIGTDSLRSTILLTSSPYTRAQLNPVRISLSVVDLDLKLDRNSTPDRPVAVLVEGRFTSAFKDRMSMPDSVLRQIGNREDGRRSALIVVSDGDAIVNAVDREKNMYYMLGYDRYARAKLYGNREFFVNAMNYLLKDQTLISLRSRAITLRQLDTARIERDRTSLQVANVALPVVLSLIGGGVFALLRKRRFSRRKASEA
ncbi:MAG TPA: gliding motility-associated ABC transporter substrate-binding protein GldG [Flavobacteriales bacterium]